MTVLSGKLDDHNTPEQPQHVVPVTTSVTAGQLAGGKGVEFAGFSFTVLDLKRSGTHSP